MLAMNAAWTRVVACRLAFLVVFDADRTGLVHIPRHQQALGFGRLLLIPGSLLVDKGVNYTCDNNADNSERHLPHAVL